MRVTICDATGSDTNPFVEITVAAPALPSHLADGDLFPVPADGCPAAGEDSRASP